MGRTTRYLIALAAWIFAGFLILPVGQLKLIAGADSKSSVALLIGAAIILLWIAGAWFGCYKLFGGGSPEMSGAGAAVKALGGMVAVMFLTINACYVVAPLLKPKPDKDFLWTHLDRTNSFAVGTFIRTNPGGPHNEEAKKLLKTLEASDWNRIQTETSLQRKASELDLYLRMDSQVYPLQHEREAKDLLDDVEWQQVLKAAPAAQGDRARAYLLLHRDGKHCVEATKMTKGFTP